MKSSLAFALLLFAATTAAAQTLPLDPPARKVMDQWRVPGMVVAVVDGDRVVALRAWGVKEIGKPDAVTPDTLFEIGSTTKAFTTTAMAMLADEKKLSWDDPVRKYVPWFRLDDPCADSLVTLRDIVTHRTGLATRDELWDQAGFTRDAVLHAVAQIPLSAPIRTKSQYSNIMFSLAGEVAASAAGTSWHDLIRTRIFTPLAMTKSRTTFADWQQSDHATGHWFDRRNDRVAIQPFRDYEAIAAAGTIKSSARDMAQWLRFQLAGGTIDGKQLLSTAALDETKKPQVALRLADDSNPESNVVTYGLGWNVQDYRGTLLVAHAGALNGFRTQVALLPKRNAGVVVIANIGDGTAVQAMRNYILDMLLGAPGARDWTPYLRALEEKGIAREEAAKKERDAKRPVDTHPSHALAAYAGTYTNAGYGTITVTNDHDALALTWGRFTVPMTHWAYDTFSAVSDAEEVDELVQFGMDVNGNVNQLTFFGEPFERKQ